MRYDKTGMQFGHWTVLAEAGKHPTGRVWRCRCDCGSISLVTTNGLNAAKNTVHGQCCAAVINQKRTEAIAKLTGR